MSQNTKAIAFENELDLISDLLQFHNHQMNEKMATLQAKHEENSKEFGLGMVELGKWGYADLGETFAQLITTFKTSAHLADLMGIEPNQARIVLTKAIEIKAEWQEEEQEFIDNFLGGDLDKVETFGIEMQRNISYTLYRMLIDSLARIVEEVVDENDTDWEIKERDEDYFSEDNIEEGIKELAESIGFDEGDLKDLAKILGM